MCVWTLNPHSPSALRVCSFTWTISSDGLEPCWPFCWGLSQTERKENMSTKGFFFSLPERGKGGGVGLLETGIIWLFRKERGRVSGKSWEIISEWVGTGHLLLMRGLGRAGRWETYSRLLEGLTSACVPQHWNLSLKFLNTRSLFMNKNLLKKNF